MSYNHQGSLRAVVDSNGTIVKEVQYDAFGNITLDTNSALHVNFGFAGGLYDPDTKLTRFGYRDYQAETGKWTAKDPIGFQGGDTNLYGYVLGDPVNLVDPTGENPFALLLLLMLLDSYLNAPNVGESPLEGMTPEAEAALWALLTRGMGPGGQSSNNMCTVTRWQNPPATGLNSQNWVMMGNKNLKNWLLSGKFTPFNPKYHVPFNSGRSFQVPKNGLKYPPGWEKFKGLPPWNQRQMK